MIDNQRHLFDIPEDRVWLNCASRTPLLKAVRDAGHNGVDRKFHPWTIDEGERHDEAERVRALFAGLIGANADDIAIQPSAAYGLATAAANLALPADGRIVVLEGQFPSNVYVWQDLAKARGAEIVTVTRPDDGDWTRAVLAALDERLAIAALPPCLWSDATRLDLDVVADAVHDIGAALVIDSTQATGASAIDVGRLDPDFLVSAGYKWLMGPYTQSFLYAAPRHHAGRPLESHSFNHPSVVEGPTNYPAEFTPAARRYDMGEFMNLINLPMVEAALAQVAAWGPTAIQQTQTPMTARSAAAARDRGLKVVDDDQRLGHYLSVGRPDGWPGDTVARLGADQVHVSMRAGLIRISPHLHTSDDDIRRFFECLDAL